MKNLHADDAKSFDTGSYFAKLYNIIRSLRGPNGCPWDLEQTALTLRNSLLEETHEAVEAINENNKDHIREELGDVLLVVMLIGYISEQDEHFSIADVIDGLNQKLIRRHPHVFGENEDHIQTTDEVLIQWDRIKSVNEGRGAKTNLLDSVPKHLPLMDRAFSLQKKAAKNGFDWQDYRGVIEKIREELDEVEDALTQMEEDESNDEQYTNLQAHLEEEIGDVLFSAINLSRSVDVHPNEALSRTNEKFYKRFSYVEKKMLEAQLELDAKNLNQMELFWIEAKSIVK